MSEYHTRGFTAMRPSASEKVFLDEQGVLVTSERLVLQTRIFMVRHLLSLRRKTDDSNRIREAFGVVACLGVGAYCLYVAFQHAAERDYGAMTGTLFSTVVFGAVPAIILGYLMFRTKTIHILVLTTAGGQEIPGLASRDEAFIGRVQAAVEQALTAK